MDEMIIFNSVYKYYDIHREKDKTIKEEFIRFLKREAKNKEERICVLNNASFSIKKGDTVGIIGRNGAGKSTTLKLIAGILKPNSGTIDVNGSLCPLLEIGLGFHPELTGRENAYLYGSFLGISRKEMDGLIEDIIEFSELEQFIDVAIKSYSSGMHMRLAFSVAVSTNKDIVLLDEVFSVGDEHFQSKSFSKILDFKKNNKTIVLVSHDMNIVRTLCNTVIFVDDLGVVSSGYPEEQINLYHEKIIGGG